MNGFEIAFNSLKKPCHNFKFAFTCLDTLLGVAIKTAAAAAAQLHATTIRFFKSSSAMAHCMNEKA